MDFFEMQKYFMIVVWLIAGISQLMGAFRKPWREYSWIKVGFGIISIYWLFYYFQSAFVHVIEINHQVWVRTPLLVTGSFVAAAGLYTLLRVKNNDH